MVVQTLAVKWIIYVKPDQPFMVTVQQFLNRSCPGLVCTPMYYNFQDSLHSWFHTRISTILSNMALMEIVGAVILT